MQRLGTEETLVVPTHEELEVPQFPKPPLVPKIEDPDLEELAERSFIYDRDQPIFDRIMNQRRYDQALDELERYIKDHEDKKTPTVVFEAPDTEELTPTELYEKPTLVRAKNKTERLLKLCAKYYQLCYK